MKGNWEREIHVLCTDFIVPYTVESKAILQGKSVPEEKAYEAAMRVLRPHLGL